METFEDHIDLKVIVEKKGYHLPRVMEAARVLEDRILELVVRPTQDEYPVVKIDQR